jgi:hypothetical protein
MVNRNVSICKMKRESSIRSAARPGAPMEYVVKLEEFIGVYVRPDAFIRTISLFRAADWRKHIMNNK